MNENPLKDKTYKKPSRYDQVYKCLVCDEIAVRWDGKNWTCTICGNVFYAASKK